jgi:gamma-glutamyl hydrolase
VLLTLLSLVSPWLHYPRAAPPLQANDRGDYTPMHGTCLGMETLAVVVSSNYTLLSDMDAEDAAATLLYTDVAQDSHFFSSLPPSVVRNLQNSAIAMENHMHGAPRVVWMGVDGWGQRGG